MTIPDPGPATDPTPDPGRLSAATLFAAVVATGLSAGFFHGWQVGTIPGLRIVDAVTYVQAMNGVNAEIRNAGFGWMFFGSAILMALALLLRVTRPRGGAIVPIAAALLLYLGGLVGVTFAVHVPMNEALLAVTDPAAVDIEAVRAAYESRWNAWHLVRTAAALLAFVLLLLAVFRERG